MSALTVLPALPWGSPLGVVDARAVAPDDTDLLHGWVTHPRSRFWLMQGASRADVAAEFAQIAASPHHDAWLLLRDGVPFALTETYDPAASPLAGLHPFAAGDVGMHVLVAPPVPGEHVAGLTDVAFTAAMLWALARPVPGGARRVVVEPDIENRPIHAKNAAAGFAVVNPVDLGEKTALLSIATRADFAASPLARRLLPPHPKDPA